MLLSELKEKSYFRYFQLLINNCSDDQNLIRIFLLEKELIKIYYSSEENLLKKIRYKWLIEELINSKSKFPLVIELQKIDQIHLKDLQKYISNFEKITDIAIDSKDIIQCFTDISVSLNNLINNITKIAYFKTSNLFQLLHLMYFGNKRVDYELIKYNLPMLEEIEHCEKIFVNIFINRIKKNKKLKISKITFILRVLFNF